MENIKTLEDVKKSNLFGTSNFDNIINNSLEVINNNPELSSKRNMDIGDTPISPMALDDDDTLMIFSKEVMDYYKKLVDMINIEETAKEYSFVLLGKSGTFADMKCFLIDQMINCDTDETELYNRQTSMDQEKLNDAVKFGLQNGYDFFSIGHTHPNIPEEEKKETVANYLSDEAKKEAYIREPGLNLSLQDFISYEGLYDYFKDNPNIKTAQTVIMFNGEMAMISKTGSKLNRMTFLVDRTNGEEIYVSRKENYNKKSQKI